MSASGYKQTCGEVGDYVRFAPKSGHSEAQERVGLKKRTSDVRLWLQADYPTTSAPLPLIPQQQTF